MKKHSWIFTFKSALFWFLLIIITILSSSVFAATNQSITLDAAIEMALKYNYQVISAGNDLEKAKLAVKQEIIKVFPQASIEGAYKYDLNQETYPNNYTLVISETIPTKANLYGKKVVSSIDVSVWDQVYNEAQFQITRANVIYNTTERYMNALKAEQVLQLQETALKNAQTTHNLALEQLRQGKITKTTQLKAESDLANADFNLEKGRADLTIALQQLGAQIGLDDITQISLVDETKSFNNETLNSEQLKTVALKNRLELQQSQITIKKAEREVAMAVNQGLPAVSISYNNVDQTQSYGVSYNFLSGDISWDAAQRNTIIKTSDSSSDNDRFGDAQENIALKLTWSLDFGIARNQASQAKLALENAKISQKQTTQSIYMDLDQAISDYRIACKKTESNQRAIPYYQKDLEIKKLQFQLGTATQLDVSTAEQSLLQARIEVVKSGYDQLIAYQKLKLVSGELYFRKE